MDFMFIALVHHFVQSDKSAPTDKQDIGGIYLEKLLLRMFPATFRGNVRHGSFDDLQQSLLNTFTGNIPRNARILGLPRNLVNFVNIDNAAARAGYIVVRVLKQREDDVLHIFPHIPGFGQRGRIGNGKRHIQYSGQRLGKERLPGTRGSDQENVALLKLHSVEIGLCLDSLVVIVHRHRQDFLRLFLADDVFVQSLLELRGVGDLGSSLPQLFLFVLLRNDFIAKLNAFVADVDRRPRYELPDFILALAAKGTVKR